MKEIVYWLKQIFSALQDLGRDHTTDLDKKSISLSGLPSSSTDTVPKLNATGLTGDEIKAVLDGKRFAIVKDGIFYRIDKVSFVSEEQYSISFSAVGYILDSNNAVVPAPGSSFFTAARNGEAVNCTAIVVG